MTNTKSVNQFRLILMVIVLIAVAAVASMRSGLLDNFSYFKPKVQTAKDVYRTAPPKEISIPEEMNEVANAVYASNGKFAKLASLRKETSLKGDILEHASRAGITVNFDEEVKDTNVIAVNNRSPQQRSPEQVRTLPQFPRPDFSKTVDEDDLNENVTVSRNIVIKNAPVAVSLPEPTSRLSEVTFGYRFSLDSNQIVVLKVGDSYWNTNDEHEFDDLKIDSIGNESVCVVDTLGESKCLGYRG